MKPADLLHSGAAFGECSGVSKGEAIQETQKQPNPFPFFLPVIPLFYSARLTSLFYNSTHLHHKVEMRIELPNTNHLEHIINA